MKNIILPWNGEGYSHCLINIYSASSDVFPKHYFGEIIIIGVFSVYIYISRGREVHVKCIYLHLLKKINLVTKQSEMVILNLTLKYNIYFIKNSVCNTPQEVIVAEILQ